MIKILTPFVVINFIVSASLAHAAGISAITLDHVILPVFLSMLFCLIMFILGKMSRLVFIMELFGLSALLVLTAADKFDIASLLGIFVFLFAIFTRIFQTSRRGSARLSDSMRFSGNRSTPQRAGGFYGLYVVRPFGSNLAFC